MASLALACALAGSLAACGDDLRNPADAGVQRSTGLEILTPPGDSIGLGFSESATLRVRHIDDQGLPISGAALTFKLVTSPGEATGGASLSTAVATTDELGIARVDLLSGAERVNFRVEVSAAQAPPVLFYIQVSEQGFANLKVRSVHDGPRDPESYERVQLRIYSQPQISCQSLDFDDLPMSFFPSRVQSALGDTSTYANLAADESYTVIAWAERGTSRALATGCLDLAADKLRSGATFEASLTVVDRSYELSGPLLLQSEIDLSLLRDSLAGQRTWEGLACPLGRAQLLLDCLADAQVGDGLMDCDGESASALSTAMAPRRGVLDANGCRGALDSVGAASIDSQLAASLGGWPSEDELNALTIGRSTVLDVLQLRSRLSPQSSNVASHRLLEAALGDFVTDLVASDRPVIEATGVPLGLSASPVLTLGRHGFTLRYGQLAAEAYEQLSLEPANVATLGASLGTEFMTGISVGAQTGCTALETLVCSNLALPASCANGCSTIATPLNTLLGEWLAQLASTGLDFDFALQAASDDDNDDLAVDRITVSDGAEGGQLDIELSTSSESFALPATLSGSPE